MNRASMMMMEGERAGRVRWREVEKRMEKGGPDNMDEERPQDGGRKKSKRCGRGQPLVVFTTTTFRFRFALFWDTQLPTTHVITRITTSNNASTPRVTLA